MNNKKTILLFADWFEPGYKAGGPIRSCLNFAQQMKDRYRIMVFTTDRDLNAKAPYEGVVIGKWTSFDAGIDIYYAPPQQLSWRFVLRQVRQAKPDFIYLNSMYSRFFAVYPLLMRRLRLISQPIVLAPRGMLRESALQFRKDKKKIFLTLLRWMGVHRLVRFHATDDTEMKDIRRQFGDKVETILAPNFAGIVKPLTDTIIKNENELSIIFVGRIHPIKNLDYLLQLLPCIKGKLQLTIVGSEEDKLYAEQCKKIVAGYPENVQVHFAGEIPNHQVGALIAKHHLLVLPTQGENFGHAIFEALSAGRPVLISDQTPWRQLAAARAGWDLALGNQQAFIDALQQAMHWNQQVFDSWSQGAWQHAAQFSKQTAIKEQYYKLFQ